MSIFVADDLVEVEIRYAQLGATDLVILHSKEEEKFYEGKVKVKIVKAKFARPGWQLFNEYMDETLIEEGMSVPTLNTIRLRRNKFRTLIEYLEDDGQPIPLTPDLEKKIIPDIPIALVQEYDRILNEERISILKEKGILEEEEDDDDGGEDDADKSSSESDSTEPNKDPEE